MIDLHRYSRWDVFMCQGLRSLPVNDPNLYCYIHKV